MGFALEAERTLRRDGLRITPMRRALLALLEEQPLDAPGLHRELRRRGVRVDRVSVYRNVATLLGLGLVHRVLGSAAVRPCATPDGARPAAARAQASRCHHAIVCTACGAAREFSSESVERALSSLRTGAPGFVVHGHLLELRGLCAACAPPRRTAAKPGAAKRPAPVAARRRGKAG